MQEPTNPAAAHSWRNQGLLRERGEPPGARGLGVGQAGAHHLRRGGHGDAAAGRQRGGAETLAAVRGGAKTVASNRRVFSLVKVKLYKVMTPT